MVIGCGYPQGPRQCRTGGCRPGGLPVTVAALTVNRFVPRGCKPSPSRHEIILEGATRPSAAASRAFARPNTKSDPNPWVKEHYPEFTW